MTYHHLSLGRCAAALLLLAAGVALMLVAQRCDWRPSLAVALYTAVVLRLVMLALAWRIQPYDLVHDFQTAGLDVLHHKDPILNNRQNGWGSLPVYAFVLAGAAWTTLHLHVSWLVIARIPAILADLGVVVLVDIIAGAGGERAALRRFQYACNPLAILVSSVHGQLEPACFLFALGAFAIVLRAGPQVSGRLAAAAGILLGLAIATQTWPAVVGPALLLALPSWRRRAQFAAGAAGVGAVLFASLPLTVGTPAARLPYIAGHIAGTHPPHRDLGLVRGMADRSPDTASSLAGPAVAERGVDRHQGRRRRGAARGVLVAPRPPPGHRDRDHHGPGGAYAIVRHPVPALAGTLGHRPASPAVDTAADRPRSLRGHLLPAHADADRAQLGDSS